MGLYRKNRASPRVRRVTAWWTSIGVCTTVAAGVVVVLVSDAFQIDYLRHNVFTVHDGSRSRRLNNIITDDPLIKRPTDCTANEKATREEMAGKYECPLHLSDTKGWIIVHIIIIGYMLLGLNTVCDAYFTGALDQMVNQWNIKPDVAGATFMAAGGSAPELFSSLIGTIVSENDVGFGTIVGSAVFNVLFVIGLCGFAAKEAISLTWWPLFRDCVYYLFGLVLLAIFASSGHAIELWEAVLLFLTYIGYCVVMYFNESLESKLLPVKIGDDTPPRLDQVAPVPDTGSTGGSPSTPNDQPQQVTEQPHHIRVAQPKFNRSQSQHDPNRRDSEAGKRESDCEAIGEEGAELEEEEEDDIEALLLKPDSTIGQAMWYFSLPIYVPLYYLTPKPSERWFLATFFVALLWIAGFSLFLVYCVETLGEVLNIHIIVMGFTLLAAGTSIPDAVSSVAVARAGEGDMAVSSSIGSNIFDILVGLPIPWMLKIGFVDSIINGNSGTTVKIKSDYIVLYVLILMFMVFCVVVSIHFLGWVLNRKLGVGMTFLYVIFLVIVLTVEFTTPPGLKF